MEAWGERVTPPAKSLTTGSCAKPRDTWEGKTLMPGNPGRLNCTAEEAKSEKYSQCQHPKYGAVRGKPFSQ